MHAKRQSNNQFEGESLGPHQNLIRSMINENKKQNGIPIINGSSSNINGYAPDDKYLSL